MTRNIMTIGLGMITNENQKSASALGTGGNKNGGIYAYDKISTVTTDYHACFFRL